MKNALIGGFALLIATGCALASASAMSLSSHAAHPTPIELVGWGDNGQGGGYGGTPQNQNSGSQGGTYNNQGGTYNNNSGNQGGTYNENNNQGTYNNDNYPKKKKRKHQGP